MEAFVQQYWSIILGAITFIIWLVRLEGKASNNLKRIEKLEDQHAIIEQMALDIREIKTNMNWLLKEQKVQ